jgi:hypothetical protein
LSANNIPLQHIEGGGVMNYFLHGFSNRNPYLKNIDNNKSGGWILAKSSFQSLWQIGSDSGEPPMEKHDIFMRCHEYQIVESVKSIKHEVNSFSQKCALHSR